jgi:6-phosphogluconolactonase
MTTKVVPGVLIATPDPAGVAQEAASRMGKALRDAITKRGVASLALSGGNTPRPAYALLAADTRVDWTKVRIFFIDERAVPPDHERSNYRLVKESLLDAAGVPAQSVHRMRGEAPDLDAAATEYEGKLRSHVAARDDVPARGTAAVPALDVIVMGIGEDGHTASLFPGDAALDASHRLVVPVAPSAEREARLTLTAPAIEHARACIVIAVGASKQAPLERAWSTHGDVRVTPARLLRNVRGSITWIIDRAAGGLG